MHKVFASLLIAKCKIILSKSLFLWKSIHSEKNWEKFSYISKLILGKVLVAQSFSCSIEQNSAQNVKGKSK